MTAGSRCDHVANGSAPTENKRRCSMFAHLPVGGAPGRSARKLTPINLLTILSSFDRSVRFCPLGFTSALHTTGHRIGYSGVLASVLATRPHRLAMFDEEVAP